MLPRAHAPFVRLGMPLADSYLGIVGVTTDFPPGGIPISNTSTGPVGTRPASAAAAAPPPAPPAPPTIPQLPAATVVDTSQVYTCVRGCCL